tara:strand:+ start:51 stop:536 length:486 start_codon:yes stop_codon:yes gene_type:complete
MSCNNPDCACSSESIEDVYNNHDANIQKHGISIQGVFGDEEHQGFAYTIGAVKEGKADCIFIGSCHEVFCDISTIGVGLAPGYYSPGSKDNPLNLPFWIVDASHHIEERSTMAREWAARNNLIQDLNLVQIVLPDPNGLFPWDEGYDWADQDITQRPYTVN